MTRPPSLPRSSCPVHRHRTTLEGLCPECLIEADQAVALIVAGVAGARSWAEKVLARYRAPRRKYGLCAGTAEATAGFKAALERSPLTPRTSNATRQRISAEIQEHRARPMYGGPK